MVGTKKKAAVINILPVEEDSLGLGELGFTQSRLEGDELSADAASAHPPRDLSNDFQMSEEENNRVATLLREELSAASKAIVKEQSHSDDQQKQLNENEAEIAQLRSDSSTKDQTIADLNVN